MSRTVEAWSHFLVVFLIYAYELNYIFRHQALSKLENPEESIILELLNSLNKLESGNEMD